MRPQASLRDAELPSQGERGVAAVHQSFSKPGKDANLLPVTLAFCLHLEVAQVGISWNFLQGSAYIIDSKRLVANWQSGGHGFDPRQLHQENEQLTRFLKSHFSLSNANICRLFADFVLRIFRKH